MRNRTLAPHHTAAVVTTAVAAKIASLRDIHEVQRTWLHAITVSLYNSHSPRTWKSAASSGAVSANVLSNK